MKSGKSSIKEIKLGEEMGYTRTDINKNKEQKNKQT